MTSDQTTIYFFLLIAAPAVAAWATSRWFDALRRHFPLPPPEAQAILSPRARLGLILLHAPLYARLSSLALCALAAAGAALGISLLGDQPPPLLLSALGGTLVATVRHGMCYLPATLPQVRIERRHAHRLIGVAFEARKAIRETADQLDRLAQMVRS